MTVTPSAGGVTQTMSIVVAEFSGLDTVAPLDKTAAAIGSGTTPSSGNMTPAVAGELAIGGGTHNVTTTTSAGAGFTLVAVAQEDSSTNQPGAMDYQVLTGTSAVAATFSLAASGFWMQSGALFKPSPKTLSATPSSLAFGSVTVNSSSSLSTTIKNTGTLNVTLSSATVTGTGMSITSQPTYPLVLAPNATTTYTVQFAPTATGAVTGNLAINSDATPSPLNVALSGTGQTATYLVSANPTSLAFGNVVINTSSTLTTTVTNTGNSSVTLNSASITGTGMSIISSQTYPLTLLPGAFTTYTVQFAPTATGAVTGNLAITSNATPSPLNVALSGTGVTAGAAGGVPRLFFTDLTSGPNTGGENNNGAYVTIYGNFFGSNPTVTVGGGSAPIKLQPSPYLWYQKMTIQLGASAATGNIVVTNSSGSSNGLPFTVRAGNIYFVSTTGSDSAAGTISAPWQTLHKVRDTIANGDIAYLRAGTWNSTLDSEVNSSSIIMFASTGGTSTAPKAMIAYPGESVTWSGAGKSYVSYNWTGTPVHDWVFAGITWDGVGSTTRIIDGGVGYNNVRFVGNTGINSTNVCWNFEGSSTSFQVYGNDISKCSPGQGTSDHGYSLYFGAYGTQDGIDVGWNSLHDNYGRGKGIQVYGHVRKDLFRHIVIHDNWIYNMCSEALEIGGSDGPTSVFLTTDTHYVYDNLIARNGYCEFNYGYSAIHVTDSNLNLKIWNNTFYWNGDSPLPSPSRDIDDDGGVRTLNISNNIFYGNSGNHNQCSGYICFDAGATSAGVTGQNNIFFNQGNGPSYLTGNINLDPKFVQNGPQPTNIGQGSWALYDMTQGNWRLQSTSPGVDAGITLTQVTIDLDGILRPQGPAYDIGAYEFH